MPRTSIVSAIRELRPGPKRLQDWLHSSTMLEHALYHTISMGISTLHTYSHKVNTYPLSNCPHSQARHHKNKVRLLKFHTTYWQFEITLSDKIIRSLSVESASHWSTQWCAECKPLLQVPLTFRGAHLQAETETLYFRFLTLTLRQHTGSVS
jgi:hypothetical protein